MYAEWSKPTTYNTIELVNHRPAMVFARKLSSISSCVWCVSNSVTRNRFTSGIKPFHIEIITAPSTGLPPSKQAVTLK